MLSAVPSKHLPTLLPLTPSQVSDAGLAHLAQLPAALKGCYVFLSVFKLEDRRGWTELVEAFFSEFSGNEQVALVQLEVWLIQESINMYTLESAVDRWIESAESLVLHTYDDCNSLN